VKNPTDGSWARREEATALSADALNSCRSSADMPIYLRLVAPKWGRGFGEGGGWTRVSCNYYVTVGGTLASAPAQRNRKPAVVINATLRRVRSQLRTCAISRCARFTRAVRGSTSRGPFGVGLLTAINVVPGSWLRTAQSPFLPPPSVFLPLRREGSDAWRESSVFRENTLKGDVGRCR